jgi:1-acyl-sn-glycerol-3-phosphate acyltransferase
MLFFSIALYPFDRQRRVAHMQCYWWSDAVIAINPYWKVKVSGLENIDHKKTYVIIANHQSMADITIAYQMKTQFKWVAKDSLFRVPFLGWSMSLGKHIKLERGDFSSIKHVYREAAVWIKDGMSVLFFPEGTRSETGKLKEFQNGAFKLAIKEGVPVLPVAIKGTFDVIKKGSWLFTPKADIRLTVLPAIETSGMGQGDFAALRDRAHDAIEKA